MTQRRFNTLTILSLNNSLVDKLPLVKAASDFTTVPQIAEMILEFSQKRFWSNDN